MNDGWGSNLSQFFIENLEPGEETVIVMNVTSPDDSDEDDWSLSFVEVTSMNRDHFSDSVQMNTSVRIPIIDLSLSVDSAEKGGDPGTTVVYTVSLENTGSDPDDFVLEIIRCDDCSAWGVDLSTYEILALEDGDVFEVGLYVDVPSSARNTESAEMGVIAHSKTDTTVTDDITTLTTVDKVLNRHVAWDAGFVMNPGDSSDMSVTITNLGNSHQSYTFESDEIPDGWTFGNLPYQTMELDPYGGAEDFNLPFTIADNENPGFFNFTIDELYQMPSYR